MPVPIQLRRSAIAAPGVMPTFGPDGELIYGKGGFTDAPAHVAGNELLISDGVSLHSVVGPQRQVELIGAQNVTGRKTFSLVSFSLTGGNPNDMLATDGAGNLVWAPAATGGGPATVASDGITIQGNGAAATPIALITSIFTGVGSGLAYAPGAVSVVQATQTEFGGLFIASDIEVTTGTSDVEAITPRSLRVQFGLDIAALTTTVKTVVPAINELHAEILALSNVLVLGGAYDVATDVVSSGGVVVPNGPLPVAAAANTGYYVIVTVGGTGTGNAPAVVMNVGDWIVSTGTAWTHIPLAQGTVLAANVGLNPLVMGADNVQDALVALEARVVVTDTSLSGNGTAGLPLALALVDGGTF